MADYLSSLARQIVMPEAIVWSRPVHQFEPHPPAEGLDSPLPPSAPIPSVVASHWPAGGPYRAAAADAVATSLAVDPSVERQNKSPLESPAPQSVTGAALDPTPAVPGGAQAEAPVVQRTPMASSSTASAIPRLTEPFGSRGAGTLHAASEARAGNPAGIDAAGPSTVPRAPASPGGAAGTARDDLDGPRAGDPAAHRAVPVAAKVSRDRPREPHSMGVESTAALVPKLPDATWPRASVAGDADAPTVHVTIGRVEVRCVSPAAAPSRRPGTTPKPALSLSDYLRRRNGGLP